MPPVHSPKAKIRKWEFQKVGTRIYVLCIGINEYTETGWTQLKNPISDAECVEECFRKIPDTKVYFERSCRNPATKKSIENVIRDFVKQIDKQHPPRIILIYYAGHGLQDGANIYIVPAKGNPKDQSTLKDQCLSHDELFRILREQLDDLIDVEDVLYFVILDTCRTALGNQTPIEAGFSAEIHEPLTGNRPKHWLLCTSTARGSTAYDGSDGNSPFIKALLSEECGFFRQNVPLAHAFKVVDARMGAQKPCLMPVQNIPESLCMYECQRRAAEKFDVFLCYRDGGPDRDLAQRLKDKLQPLRVFFEAERAPAHEQVADAMRNSIIILMLISHDTFEGVDKLGEASTAKDDPLVPLLCQYEMALELYDAKCCTPVPMLVGSRNYETGREEFKSVDPYKDHKMFWPLHKVPNIQVKEVVEHALAGLRCDAQAASDLNDGMLRRCVQGIPSIIRGLIMLYVSYASHLCIRYDT